MPEQRIMEFQDKVSQRAGGTITCPICAHEGWTPMEVVVSLLTSTLAFWRNAQKSQDERAESTDQDDADAMPTLAAVCTNCGFVRLHAVQPDALLEWLE